MEIKEMFKGHTGRWNLDVRIETFERINYLGEIEIHSGQEIIEISEEAAATLLALRDIERAEKSQREADLCEEELEIPGLGRLTCQHAASAYGQPVLIIEGEAYGSADVLPSAPDDPLPWLKEPAAMSVLCRLKGMNLLEHPIVQKFIA